MKRLLLLRHAKAERGESDDHKRALTPRGRDDAGAMGRFLRTEAYVPNTILCSTSARTLETVECLLPQIGAEPMVRYLSELYLAEPELILAVVRRAPARSGVLMVVGHNPGIEDCAGALADIPSQKKQRKHYNAMEEKFPTCALAVIDFEIPNWADVAPRIGELKAFVRPKDLLS